MCAVFNNRITKLSINDFCCGIMNETSFQTIPTYKNPNLSYKQISNFIIPNTVALNDRTAQHVRKFSKKSSLFCSGFASIADPQRKLVHRVYAERATPFVNH